MRLDKQKYDPQFRHLATVVLIKFKTGNSPNLVQLTQIS